jgi:hypothetical protein
MQAQRVCHNTLPWFISFSLGPLSYGFSDTSSHWC